MLNRIKNILIAITAGICISMPAFALDSTVSYININDRAYYDVEIVITDKSEILVPFKQLADLFDIKYTANRVDKFINFKTYDGKDGVINQNGVFVQDYSISNCKPIFMGQGIMDGVFNEAYVTPDVINKIMGVKVESNFEDLTIIANVERDIPLLANINNEVQANNKEPHAYQNIIAPKKQGKITLNTIGLRTNLLNTNMSTKNQYYSTSYGNFTGSTQASLNGNIWGGKYRIEANEYHYRSDAFMFGGVSGTYRNSIKDKETNKDKVWYELGKIRGTLDVDSSNGQNTFGVQVWNYNNEKEEPNKIFGYVKPTSLVRLTVNDLEPVMLSTYAGYYTLKDVQLPNPVKTIKLEEVNEDGTVELIKEERYSIYGKKPFEKEHRATAYAGVWGYQNRFFREGNNIYRGNNKKVAVGAEYEYGIKDNLTLKSKVTADKIYQKVNASSVYRMPTNDTLLVTGTQKSVNYIEGATSLSNLDWVSTKNPNIKARLTAGASVAHDIREEHTHAGYIAKATGQYEKDLTEYQKGILKPKKVSTKLELFQTSPDFYIASSDSSSKNDRTGGRATAGVSFNSTNVNGSYSRYYSNMNHRYQGGTIKFDEASINAGTKIPKVADLRFNSYYRRGENQLGRNKNYYYDANASRQIKNWAKIQAGRRESLYDTKFEQETSLNHSYNSKFADNYAQLDIPIPGNHGKFMFGHSIVRYDTNNYKNGYNMFRFGYSFPTWKRLTLSLGYGFRYHGQGGNDINVNLAYRAKSGQTMNVGYQYTQNGGYFIDNMFLPTTNRHSINFLFNDAFQVFNHGLKSVGQEDLNKGLFEAIAFVDIDKDGKFNKKVDIPIKNIPLIISWSGETCITNKRGRVYSSSVEQGVYNVSIDMNQLPITVAPLTNDLITRSIKIDGGNTTLLEIPLISTVGSVSGELKIFDEFERNLKITDFVVILIDENGNEVNYSTVDSDGKYYISGLAPGNYTLKLDENFVNSYGLEEVANKSEINIFIPFDYENSIDIVEQNLEYKTLSL